ncbi:MAG TPA: hypothetical protein VE442_09330 [Jatrophihabitans sp.]|nr:hypothetical protein [Jatrophihabitans sp.]
MPEHVVPVDLIAGWDPNAPHAVMISADSGTTVLALDAHQDDADQRCVVLVWTGVASASMSAPNDEAISGHRLYDKGLDDVRWVGVVRESELVADLERRSRAQPGHTPARYERLVHHVVLLKECTVEVVAELLSRDRIAGPTAAAAAQALPISPAEPAG